MGNHQTKTSKSLSREKSFNGVNKKTTHLTEAQKFQMANPRLAESKKQKSFVQEKETTENKQVMSLSKQVSFNLQSSCSILSPRQKPVSNQALNSQRIGRSVSSFVLMENGDYYLAIPGNKPFLKKEDSERMLTSPNPNKDDINCFIKKMKKFTGKKNYSTIYNSKIDGLNSKSLNDAVCGHRNLLFVIIGNNDEVFGCYQEDEIPKEVDSNVQSEEFFLFSLVKNYSFKWERIGESNNSLTLYGEDESDFVLTVFSAFWIKTNGCVYTNHLIKQNYDIPDITTNVFSSSPSSKPIQLKMLMVLEWES